MSARIGQQLHRVGRSGPARRAIVLFGGATAANAIPVLMAPVFTRLYTSSAYGMMTLFVAATTIVGACMTGRYHMAVVMPSAAEEEDAVALTWLSLGIAVTVAAVLTLACGAFLVLGFPLGPLQPLGWWNLLVPLGALLAVGYEVFSMFALRHDAARAIARGATIKAAATAFIQALGATITSGAAGLIAGIIVAQSAGNRSLLQAIPELSQGTSRKTVHGVARRYIRFPQYDLLSNLINVVGQNLILFGVAFIYGKHELGLFAVAFRLISIPLQMISSVASQVFLREMARLDSPAERAMAFQRALVALLALSIPIFVPLGLLPSKVFGYILGDHWFAAGALAAALTPVLWARFVSSPLSTVFLVAGRQRALLGWQVAIVAVNMVVLVGAYQESWTLASMVLSYSLCLAVLYLLLAVHAWRISVES